MFCSKKLLKLKVDKLCVRASGFGATCLTNDEPVLQRVAIQREKCTFGYSTKVWFWPINSKTRNLWPCNYWYCLYSALRLFWLVLLVRWFTNFESQNFEMSNVNDINSCWIVKDSWFFSLMTKPNSVESCPRGTPHEVDLWTWPRGVPHGGHGSIELGGADGMTRACDLPVVCSGRLDHPPHGEKDEGKQHAYMLCEESMCNNYGYMFLRNRMCQSFPTENLTLL